jgi:hypothetical protein
MPRSVQLQGGRLQFYGIQVSDAGRYVCTAYNAQEKAEGIAEVIVSGKYHGHREFITKIVKCIL